MHGLLVSSVAATALLLGATATQGQSIPLDEAQVLAELNDTDGDLGFHALFDGEAWDRLTVRDPDGRLILLGPASPEPRAAGPDRAVLRERRAVVRRAGRRKSSSSASPRGRYTISGRTLEGDRLEGSGPVQPCMPAQVDNVADRHAARRGLRGRRPAGGRRARGDQLGPGHDSHPTIGNPTSAPIRVGAVRGRGRARGAHAPGLQHRIAGQPARPTRSRCRRSSSRSARSSSTRSWCAPRNGNQTALESCFALEWFAGTHAIDSGESGFERLPIPIP